MTASIPKWLRRGLGVLDLGGGAIGSMAAMNSLIQAPNAVVVVFMLAFMAIYTYGMWCGIAMLEDRPDAVELNLVYWVLQVPMFSTFVFGYFISSGFHFSIYLNWDLMTLGYEWLLGSVCRFNLMRTAEPALIGLNVFALAVTAYLWRCHKSASVAIPPGKPAARKR